MTTPQSLIDRLTPLAKKVELMAGKGHADVELVKEAIRYLDRMNSDSITAMMLAERTIQMNIVPDQDPLEMMKRTSFTMMHIHFIIASLWRGLDQPSFTAQHISEIYTENTMKRLMSKADQG